MKGIALSTLITLCAAPLVAQTIGGITIGEPVPPEMRAYESRHFPRLEIFELFPNDLYFSGFEFVDGGAIRAFTDSENGSVIRMQLRRSPSILNTIVPPNDVSSFQTNGGDFNIGEATFVDILGRFGGYDEYLEGSIEEIFLFYYRIEPATEGAPPILMGFAFGRPGFGPHLDGAIVCSREPDPQDFHCDDYVLKHIDLIDTAYTRPFLFPDNPFPFLSSYDFTAFTLITSLPEIQNPFPAN